MNQPNAQHLSGLAQLIDGSVSAEMAAETANGFRGELAERLGIEMTSISRESIVGTMPVEGNRQPIGLLHGGASAALAETLGSFHAMATAGPGTAAVGIELSCTHHRSAMTGVVTGVSTPIHIGRTLSTFEIVIRDELGKRVCTARLSCLMRSAG